MTTIGVYDRNAMFDSKQLMMMGKTTRETTKCVVDDVMELPPEFTQLNHVELCIDVTNINGCWFMTSIDLTIRFRTIAALLSRTQDEFSERLQKTVLHYLKAGYQVTTIHVDGVFQPMSDAISEHFDAILITANSCDYVQETERNNHKSEERYRAGFQRTTHKAMTMLTICSLASDFVFTLHCVPARGGTINYYYSPHQIIHRRHLQYERKFGNFMCVNNPLTRTSSHEPRTINAIYLCSIPSLQDGRCVMDLQAWPQFAMNPVMMQPITEDVESRVNAMGEQEIFTRLFFQNRTYQISTDVVMLAGVWTHRNRRNDYDKDDSKAGSAVVNNNDNDSSSSSDSDSDDDNGNDDDDESNSDDDDNDNDDYNEEKGATKRAPALAGSSNLPTSEATPTNKPTKPTTTTHHPTATAAMTERQRATQQPTPTGTDQPAGVRRSKCARMRVQCTDMAQFEMNRNLIVNRAVEETMTVCFESQCAVLRAWIIQCMDEQMGSGVMNHGMCSGPDYMMEKGLLWFGECVNTAAKMQCEQLHDRVCFHPLKNNNQSPSNEIFCTTHGATSGLDNNCKGDGCDGANGTTWTTYQSVD